MNTQTKFEMARILSGRFGAKAQAVAARRELEARRDNRRDESADWRKVREFLIEARGPRAK